MAYEVGVGYLDLVPSLGGSFSRILQGAGNDIQRTLGGAGERAGEEAGGLFSGSFGKVLKAGAIVGAVVAVGKAAGAAFSSTFGEAIERQASVDKLSAQLGISDSESKALGASAGKLYAQAYGESFQGVTDAISVVKSSLKNLDAGQLEEATKKALSFSQAFDVDMARSVQSVSTLIGSGLVKDSTEAFDILTKASQQVPAALREDVLDASDEYAQFFKSLGFNGSQAFGALAKASDKGVFGIDKTGDAIKEFTIRATDMSTTSTAAFSAIGLDAQTMANDILAGGDTAQSATQKIISGLRNIKDPATQANTALALFGTPLEDLGVSNIPTFLESLQDATGGLGDFAGAADAVDKKLGNTIQAKWTSFTRTLEGFGPALSSAFLPVIGPILDSLTGLSSRGLDAINGLIDGLTGAGGQGLTDAQKKWSKFGESISESLIGPLNMVKSYAQDARGALSTLVTGNFDPSQWFAPPEEDSALIDFIFTIRETVGDTFKELMDTGKQVFDAIGPPLLEAFNTIWEALKPLVPTFLELFQAFNPVGLLFKALLPVLPKLAAIFGELAKTLAGGIARTLEALQPLFQKIVDVINRLLPFITKLIESLLPPLVSLFERIAPLLDSILDALLPLITNIIDALIPAIDAIMPVVERVFTFIADSIGNVINLFSGIIDFITGVFSGDWEKAWNGIKEIFGAVWDQLKNIVSLVWDGISAILNAAWENVIKPVFDAISSGAESVGSFFSGLWDKVKEVWNWIQDKISTVWNWIDQNVFTPMTNGVDNIGQFFSDLWTTVQNVWQWIQDKISGVWNWINQYVFAPMALGINTIGTFFGNLWQTIENIWGKISGFFANVAEGISSAIDTVRNAIGEVKKLIENFISGEWIQGSSHLGNLEVGNGLFGNIGGGARGAVVPGRDPGRRDNVLGMLPSGAFFGLRSEEAVMVPEFTHAVGGEAGVNRLNRLAEAGRIGEIMYQDGLARGGVVGKRAHDMIAAPSLALLGQIQNDISNSFAAPGAEGFNSSQDPSSFGWKRASGIVPFSWNGHQFVGGVADGTQKIWNALLSALVPQIPGGLMAPIWAYENRNNVNSPGNASFHAYGLAADINAPQNPNGAAGYGRSGPGVIPAQLAHSLAAKLGLEWGGDFRGTPDPMHFEVHLSPGALGGGSVGSAISAASSAILSKIGLSSASASPGGSGVERWRPLGLQVLQKVGAYVGKNLLPFINNMMLQIKTESSGDPNAINLTDINAQRGDPSIGLLQVIRSTFVSALQGTPFAYLIARGQRDPEASMTASTLYGLNRYGSLDRAWRGVAYRYGGIVPDWGTGPDSVPGFLTPGEGVFTPPQTQAIITHAKALEAGYAGQVSLNIHLDNSDPLQVAIAQMIEDGVAAAGREMIDQLRVSKGLG